MPKLKNAKHELLAKNIIKDNFNLTQAYRDTYPNASYKSANARVYPLVKNSEHIQNRIQEIANSKGLTLESLIDGLNETRKANKPIIFNGVITSEYPDHAVRLEATKTGLKIHGALGPDSQTSIDARSVNIQLDKSDVDKLSSIVDKMKTLRSSDSEY